MRFKIVGANSETGDDVDVVLEAASQPEVEKLARSRGILVESIASVPGVAHASQGSATHAPAAGHASVATAAAPAGATRTAPAANPGAAQGSQAPAVVPPPAHPPKEKDFSSISLVDDEPAAAGGGDPNAPHHERARGIITVNANNPAEAGHSGTGTIDGGKHAETPMEYHVILNQSLFLLEAAVNKHLRDGWEPAGGVAVGVSNNALQFFQSLIRKKKSGGAVPASAGASTGAAAGGAAAPAAAPASPGASN